MSFWKDNVKPMRLELSRRFPKAFLPEGDRTPKRPLKIGIHKDIIQRAPDLNPSILRLALRDYTQGPRYARGSEDQAIRIDLDGNPSGLVTEAEQDYIQGRAYQYQLRSRERRDATRNNNKDSGMKIADGQDALDGFLLAESKDYRFVDEEAREKFVKRLEEGILSGLDKIEGGANWICFQSMTNMGMNQRELKLTAHPFDFSAGDVLVLMPPSPRGGVNVHRKEVKNGAIR